MTKAESIKATISSIREIKPILKNHYGGKWFGFLLKSYKAGKKIVASTKWSGAKTGEAAYVRTLALLPGFHYTLLEKFSKEETLQIMENIIIAIAHRIDTETNIRHKLYDIKNPFERWIRYRAILITEGFGLYNDMDDIYISKGRIHYTVKRCIFNDFFSAAGAPELTAMFCNYDKIIQEQIFGEYYFDRNGSWENTIAYGAGECHYVWKDKNILTEEFRQTLETDGHPRSSAEGDRRSENVRRQYDRRQGDRRMYDRRQKKRRDRDPSPGDVE